MQALAGLGGPWRASEWALAIFLDCVHGPPQCSVPPLRAHSGCPPADQFAAQRAAWYAELSDRFGLQSACVDDAGRTIVWTDGGCRNDGDGRVAGFGVFYSTDSELNVTREVDGAQTSVRAELAALVCVLEEDPRPLSVRIDCQAVVDGFNVYRPRHRSRAWLRRPLDAIPIAHADLWRRADRAARRRAAACIATEVRWVKGHPLQHHVRDGVISELDAFGNSQADEMATSALHAAARVGRRG